MYPRAGFSDSSVFFSTSSPYLFINSVINPVSKRESFQAEHLKTISSVLSQFAQNGKTTVDELLKKIPIATPQQTKLIMADFKKQYGYQPSPAPADQKDNIAKIKTAPLPEKNKFVHLYGQFEALRFHSDPEIGLAFVAINEKKAENIRANLNKRLNLKNTGIRIIRPSVRPKTCLLIITDSDKNLSREQVVSIFFDAVTEYFKYSKTDTNFKTAKQKIIDTVKAIKTEKSEENSLAKHLLHIKK